MTEDRSREKSLLFLLSSVSRLLEVPPDNKKKIRDSIATLEIKEFEDRWAISALISSGTRKNVEIAKDCFIFYPVKSEARYETNPAILNRNSAQEVLLVLFDEYNVEIPGKKILRKRRSISDFLPTNLIFSSIICLFSIYNFEVFSLGLIIAHLFITTANHYFSAARRWFLIISIVIPALGFFVLSKSEISDLPVVITQIALLYSFDFAIRFQSFGNSRIKAAAVQLTPIIGFLIFEINSQRLPANYLIEIVVVTGYVLLRRNIPSSSRNTLFLLFLVLFVTYTVFQILSSPLRLLLTPYLIFIALHETLFGDNRNPSKLAFGSVCLLI